MALDALLASGLMFQLGATLDRLGGVRGRALSGTGGTAWERGELALSDSRVLESFVAGSEVDAVLIGVLGEAGGVGQLLLQARRTTGEEVWSASLSLGEDVHPDARLPLLADLLVHLGAPRRDTRRLRGGWAGSMADYGRFARVLHPDFPEPERAPALLSLLSSADERGIHLADVDLALARLYMERGSPDTAMRRLMHAAQRSPDYAPLRMELGWTFLASGRVDEAGAEVQAVLNLDPEGGLIYEAATFAERVGDEQSAGLLYSRAVQRAHLAPDLEERFDGRRPDGAPVLGSPPLWRDGFE